MKMNEFYNLIPDTDHIKPNMSIKMDYGHVGVILIRPIKINKLGQDIYITGDNGGCFTVRNIKSIIEIQNN